MVALGINVDYHCNIYNFCGSLLAGTGESRFSIGRHCSKPTFQTIVSDVLKVCYLTVNRSTSSVVKFDHLAGYNLGTSDPVNLVGEFCQGIYLFIQVIMLVIDADNTALGVVKDMFSDVLLDF